MSELESQTASATSVAPRHVRRGRHGPGSGGRRRRGPARPAPIMPRPPWRRGCRRSSSQRRGEQGRRGRGEGAHLTPNLAALDRRMARRRSRGRRAAAGVPQSRSPCRQAVGAGVRSSMRSERSRTGRDASAERSPDPARYEHGRNNLRNAGSPCHVSSARAAKQATHPNPVDPSGCGFGLRSRAARARRYGPRLKQAETVSGCLWSTALTRFEEQAYTRTRGPGRGSRCITSPCRFAGATKICASPCRPSTGPSAVRYRPACLGCPPAEPGPQHRPRRVAVGRTARRLAAKTP